MKNYDKYQIEDFVQDLSFRRWVLHKSAVDRAFWEKWLKENPSKQALIEEATAIVRAFRVHLAETNQTEINNGINTIMSEIKGERASWFISKLWMRLAAAVLLIASSIVWYYGHSFQNQSNSATSNSIIERIEANEIANNRTIKLADGSTVMLDANSSLDIDKEFGRSTRTVRLKGGAMFVVAKNADKPFYVYTGDLVTKVLGTSFRINAFEKDNNVSVSVKTGKVTVFKNEKTAEKSLSEEMILLPNQQAVFLKDANKLVKTVVEVPLILNEFKRKTGFFYSETPIVQVFQDLEQAYQVTILYDEELFKDCNLTAALSNENLFEKLTLICQTIQAKYQIIDGQIVISGRGCK